jgi:galactokinase
MTGAGFGGCAIALVDKGKIDKFGKSLIKFYNEKIGYEPTVFASEIGNGVRQIL